MTPRIVRLALVLASVPVVFPLILDVGRWTPSAQQTAYDLVIRGGRVMDPATGFDAVANVGIRGTRVAEVSRDALEGERVIDARDHIVAPGFVDILAGGFSLEGNRYKAMDGVTTILSMHGGPVDVNGWYGEQAAEGRLIHYGTTVGHGALRRAVGIEARDVAASREQIREMAQLARRSIWDGAVGIGFGIQYVPGASEDEVLSLFQVCAETNVPCHLHIRYLGLASPENGVKAVQEVIANAAATGASAQIVHLGAMVGHSRRSMATSLQLIEGARRHGVDVMADAYPWRAGSTALESAVFDPGWQERLGVTYGDLRLVSTGEVLSEDSFRRYRNDGERTSVLIFHVCEEGTVMALTHPHVMVGSDGGIESGRGHPRGAGTYAKFLREYVRETRRLSLMEALRKMSYLPAQRLVKAAPVMRRKGRLAPGSDADIVVFELDRVRERATYAEPAQYSEGFDYVLVNGTVVVRNGRLVDGVRPGSPVRGVPEQLPLGSSPEH